MRFLGLVPDDALAVSRAPDPGGRHHDAVRSGQVLADKGYLAMSGQILNASLIPAFSQRLDDGASPR